MSPSSNSRTLDCSRLCRVHAMHGFFQCPHNKKEKEIIFITIYLSDLTQPHYFWICFHASFFNVIKCSSGYTSCLYLSDLSPTAQQTTQNITFSGQWSFLNKASSYIFAMNSIIRPPRLVYYGETTVLLYLKMECPGKRKGPCFI